MKFDDLLREVGEFGPFQRRVYAMMCVPGITIGSFMILNVVILGVPEHRCKIPGLDNDTYEVQSTLHQGLINQTIPFTDGNKYESCKLYAGDYILYDGYSKPFNANTVSCSEWVYEETVFKNTFSKQINIVCDKSMLVSHAQTAFYFGVLVGSIAFGQLSDIIGRKKTLYICLMILLVSSVSLTFTVEYYSFVVILFIVGTTCLGTWMTAFVIGMEYVGPSKRVWAGCIIHVFGTCGAMYLVLMAFLWRDWQKVELSMGVPCVIYVVLICVTAGSCGLIVLIPDHCLHFYFMQAIVLQKLRSLKQVILVQITFIIQSSTFLLICFFPLRRHLDI